MKTKTWLTTFLSLLTFTNLVAKDCESNTYKTNNYLAPIGRVVLNPSNDNGTFAFSFIGEAGMRNFRLNGTGGTWTTERSRLKLGGEYLIQRLSWNYTSGKTRHYVQQGAAALDWQYLLDCQILQAFAFKGFYSYAPSKHLSSERCFSSVSQFVERRIAGAQNIGGVFSTVLALNATSTLDVSVIYDHVRYRRQLEERKLVAGFGGGFTFRSRLPGCVDIELLTEFRRPFNLYGLKFSWPKGVSSTWTTSVFANYTRGKVHLPHSMAVGLEFAFNVGGCDQGQNYCGPLWDPCDLAEWISRPAIFSPEVLAIRDEISSR